MSDHSRYRPFTPPTLSNWNYGKNHAFRSKRRHSFGQFSQSLGSKNPDLITKLDESRKNIKYTDVKFVFPGSSKVVYAHRVILAVKSPVFDVMLYGEKWEPSDSNAEIEIVDIDPQVFDLFVDYIYTGELPESLELDITINVLHAASKYSLDDLFSLVAAKLCDMVSLHNVLQIIQDAKLYDSRELERVCWNCIELDTDRVLLLNEFTTIPKTLLKEILEHEPLSASEIALYNGLVSWATVQCQLKGLNCTPETLREIIGIDILRLIRFPTMDNIKFADLPARSGLLTQDEVVNVFLTKFSTATTVAGIFSRVERNTIQTPLECSCTKIGNYCNFCSNPEELQLKEEQRGKGMVQLSPVSVPPCYCRCKIRRYCPSKK